MFLLCHVFPLRDQLSAPQQYQPPISAVNPALWRGRERFQYNQARAVQQSFPQVVDTSDAMGGGFLRLAGSVCQTRHRLLIVIVAPGSAM
jgi:hypothetical protein